MNRILWYTVKNRRKALGMSQEVLREKSGINRVLLARIENNTIRNEPDYATMAALAGTLGCGILDLVTFFPERDLNRVTVAREKRGMSKQALVEKAGISLNTLRNVEVWDKKPSRTTRKLIAAALEMDELELWPEVE